MKKKISRYEMALEKAAVKYSNLQLSNETLVNELLALRKKYEEDNVKKELFKDKQLKSLTQKIDNRNVKVVNELKNILGEMKSVLIKTNHKEEPTKFVHKINNFLDSMNESSLEDVTLASSHDITKQLCNRIETKLNQLNEMGQNLKKENTAVTELLQNVAKNKQ
jgi:hypothetical protein